MTAVIAAVLFSFLAQSIYESLVIIQLSQDSTPPYASPASAVQVLTSLGFLTEVARQAGARETGEGLRT